MNRSILIVICDFLLVSLLAFSTVDINKTTSEGVPRQVKVDLAANQTDSRQDMAAVMRLALEQERKGRDALLGELAKTREAAGQHQALLSEREKQLQTFRQELQRREQQTAQLEAQKTNLLQQFVAAPTVANSRSTAQISRCSTSLFSTVAAISICRQRAARGFAPIWAEPPFRLWANLRTESKSAFSNAARTARSLPETSSRKTSINSSITSAPTSAARSRICRMRGFLLIRVSMSAS